MLQQVCILGVSSVVKKYLNFEEFVHY